MNRRRFWSREIQGSLSELRKRFGEDRWSYGEAKEAIRPYLSIAASERAAKQKGFWEKFWNGIDPSVSSQFLDIFWALEWVDCKFSLERFAAYCKTKDEHANGNSNFGLDPASGFLHSTEEAIQASQDASVRYFPLRSEKPHIWHVLDRCLQEQLLVIEKSRQMQMSWGLSIYELWLAKFHANKLCFWQSKKEEDAANIVFNKEPSIGRISFIESNLPPELQSVDFSSGASYGQLYFPNGSKIWGIPEGGAIIRSYTASLIIEDEAAFQPEFENAFSAAMPTVKGGGQLVICSTVWPGSYMKQLRDP